MGKKLGQHFLRDRRVLQDIQAAARLEPGEQVLEVGPGEGVLTALLLEERVQLTAVELDEELFKGLVERWGDDPAIRLVQGDILTLDLTPAALFDSSRPYAIIANLPYYLSTPFFFRIISLREHISRMVLMVQREIGERLVALPENGKVYGSLSVVAHHAFKMKYLFSVPPEAFNPPPKVQSSVVEFTPRPAVMEAGEERKYFSHVQQMFQTRRKKMMNTIKRCYPGLNEGVKNSLEEFIGSKRPEALTPEQHLAAFHIISPPGISG